MKSILRHKYALKRRNIADTRPEECALMAPQLHARVRVHPDDDDNGRSSASPDGRTLVKQFTTCSRAKKSACQVALQQPIVVALLLFDFEAISGGQ